VFHKFTTDNDNDSDITNTKMSSLSMIWVRDSFGVKTLWKRWL